MPTKGAAAIFGSILIEYSGYHVILFSIHDSIVGALNQYSANNNITAAPQ